MLKPLRFKFILSYILVFLEAYIIMQLPKLMAIFVSDGILKNNPDVIIGISIQSAIFTLLGFLLGIAESFLSAKINASTREILQDELAKKVLNMGRAEISQFGTAKLLTTTTHDTSRICKLVLDLSVHLPSAFLFAIIAVIEGVRLAPELSWILIVLGVASAVIVPILMSLAIPKIKVYRKLVDKLTNFTRQNITGVKVIRAFNNEKYEYNKFLKNDQKQVRASIFIDNVFSFHHPVYSLIFSMANLLCVWFGMKMLKIDLAYLGVLAAFIDYVIRVSTAFIDIAIPISYFSRAKISIDRIMKIMNSSSTVKWVDQTIGTPSTSSKIEFKNVSFAFSNAEENLLEKISFKINEGETVAFIGSTGSGKTTLAEIIMRIHDATDGEVLINDINIKNYAKKDLISKIGYVPQKGVLFSGSIAENIKIGAKNATKSEVEEAARLAVATEFIEKLPDGYKTKVSQMGRNLSGGQRQRISIARALVKKPEILIFDDAFSALDMKTDSILRKNLRHHLNSSIKIIVAQRIGTIREADKIIVLDHGKIVGIGTHLELLSKNKTYIEIAKSQMTEAEISAELAKEKYA